MGGAHLPDSPVEYLWGRDRRQSAVVGIADRLADCEDFLSRYTNHFRTSFHMGSSNPKVRDRVELRECEAVQPGEEPDVVHRSTLQATDSGLGAGAMEAGRQRQYAP